MTYKYLDGLTIPPGTLSPGTAGQIFVTNSSPAAAWTSLISVETVHGRFTAGGAGTDFRTVVGPYPGFESTYSALWFLANGVTPTIANASLYSNATDLFISAPATRYIKFNSAGSTVVASINVTHGLFTAGGGGTDTQVVIGPDASAPSVYSAVWLLPNAGVGSSSNAALRGDGTNLYIGTIGAAGNFYFTHGGTVTATFSTTTLSFGTSVVSPTLTQATSTTAPGQDLLIQAQGTSFASAQGGNLQLRYGARATGVIVGAQVIIGGPTTDWEMRFGNPGGDPTLDGVLYILPHATASTGNNFAFLAIGADTYFNGQTGGTLRFKINNASLSLLELSTIAKFGVNIGFDSSLVSPTINQTTSSTAAGTSLTIAAQSTSFLNANGGALNLYSGAGNGTGTPGAINIGAGSTAVMQLAGGTQNGIVLGTHLATAGHMRTPNGFVWMGRNSINTGNLAIFIDDGANNYTYGSGANTTTMQAVSSVNILSNSQIAIEGLASYFDSNTLQFRDAAHGNVLLGTFNSTGASSLTIAAGVTSFAITQAVSTTGSGNNILFSPQAPLVGSNGIGGDLVVNTAASDGSGTKQGGFAVQFAGTNMVNVGAFGGATTAPAYGAIWFHQTTPAAANFAFLGSASDVYFNAPTTNMYFGIGASYKMQLNSTALLIGTVYSSPSYKFDISATAIMHFGVSATSATIQYDANTTNVANNNLVLIAQGPWNNVGNTFNDAGDVVVNTPASVNSSLTKFGGFQVQYNGTVMARIGTYGSSIAAAGMWLLDGGTPSITNYVLGWSSTGMNVNHTTQVSLAISGAAKVQLTSTLLSSSVAVTLGSTTGSNSLVGAEQHTLRSSAASFSVDNTTTDYWIVVTATQTVTLPQPTNGRELFVTIDATGTGGSDITLTVARFASESINGGASSWVATFNANGVYEIRIRSNGTNWFIAG